MYFLGKSWAFQEILQTLNDKTFVKTCTQFFLLYSHVAIREMLKIFRKCCKIFAKRCKCFGNIVKFSRSVVNFSEMLWNFREMLYIFGHSTCSLWPQQSGQQRRSPGGRGRLWRPTWPPSSSTAAYSSHRYAFRIGEMRGCCKKILNLILSQSRTDLTELRRILILPY